MASAQAKAYHSISIGDIAHPNQMKNTWDDWHIVPSSRPLINPPSPRLSFASLVGGDGSMDLTTSLTSSPTYGNRSGSWEFIVINPDQLPSATPIVNDWAYRFSDIMAFVHGKAHHIILNDDPDFYYEGRLAVTSWASEPGNSVITIAYNLDPYKRSISNSNLKCF